MYYVYYVYLLKKPTVCSRMGKTAILTLFHFFFRFPGNFRLFFLNSLCAFYYCLYFKIGSSLYRIFIYFYALYFFLVSQKATHNLKILSLCKGVRRTKDLKRHGRQLSLTNCIIYCSFWEKRGGGGVSNNSPYCYADATGLQ